MAKLTRYLQKIFANNSNQVGVFGTGTDKETSKNVETLQSADYENGWSSAIITNKNYPIWQERDGVDYGFSYQLAYLMQNGIPEWLSTETYYTNSFCQYGGKIYQSLQDNNTNHNPALNDGWWTLPFDGQWVSSNVTLAYNVTIPTSTDIEYDLSTYLPNDGYNYEVFISGSVTTTSTSGSDLNLVITSDFVFSRGYICGTQTRTSSTVTASGNAIIPVSISRKIKVSAYSGYSGTFRLFACAYRRIGTNS